MKKKILFILHMPPPVHGASMMGKYIHDSELINESFECRYINLTIAASLQDIGRIGLKKIVNTAKLIMQIFKAVKVFHPDLVYITPNAKGGAFYKEAVIVEMLKRMGCKVVAHYHNKGVATRQNRWLDNLLYRCFFKGLKVILLAEALYPDMHNYVKREDVMICPNGIPDMMRDKEIKKYRHDVPHILFLSNLQESKGVIDLLDALSILKDKGYSFVCDFVGGETAEIDADRFRWEVEERGLNRQVVYHGRKYGEEKEAFLRDADIMAFPTYYHNECFPLVLLEAMQYGTACVSTPEGAISEIIDEGNTGLIVPQKQVSALVSAIARLLTDRDLCIKMGVLGRIKYEKTYTLASFERCLAEILSHEC